MDRNDNILTDIRKCLDEHLPEGGRALLYGSQARGTARADSDWDILVILDKDKLVPSDYDNVTFPLMMLGWEKGKAINPVLYSAKEWERYAHTAFRKNVEQDAIPLNTNSTIFLDTDSTEFLPCKRP